MFKQIVVKYSDGTRSILWGSFKELQKIEHDIVKDAVVIPEEEYQAEEIAEIFGSFLEDLNYHKITDIGSILNSVLKNNNIGDKERADIVKNFANAFCIYHNIPTE